MANVNMARRWANIPGVKYPDEAHSENYEVAAGTTGYVSTRVAARLLGTNCRTARDWMEAAGVRCKQERYTNGRVKLCWWLRSDVERMTTSERGKCE